MGIIPAIIGAVTEFAGAAEGGLGALGGALGIGEAAAAPAEAGALALPAIDVGAGAGAGLAGADAAAIGASAAGGIPEIVIPAAAGSAGIGAGDIAAGLGAAGLGAGSALALSPNSVMGGEFGPFGSGDGTTPVASVPTPTAPTTPTLPGVGSPGAGGGVGAASLAGPSGLDATPTIGPGVNPTALDISAPAAGPAATAPASTASTDSSFLGGVGNFFKNNPGLAASLGIGLGGQLLAPKLAPLITGKVPGSDQLNQLASQEAQFQQQQNQLGQELTQPLLTGKLPPDQQQAVTNAVNDAISTTKARYASLGLSGSTMEADAIANIQNQSTGLKAQLEQQMAQTGLAATSQSASAFGLQNSIYSQLMQAQIQQDQALQNAIAQFASAAAIGTGIASKKAA